MVMFCIARGWLGQENWCYQDEPIVENCASLLEWLGYAEHDDISLTAAPQRGKC
jgi:hypothetical protein